MARVWRRRRSLDTPRPAGRRWLRLRRGGSRATKLIARVGLRRDRALDSPVLVAPVSPVVGPTRLAEPVGYTPPVPLAEPKPVSLAEPAPVPLAEPTPVPLAEPTPVSLAETAAVREASAPRTRPAIAAASEVEPATALLPGERTPARRVKFAIVNGCTVSSLVMGLVAVFLAMTGDPTKLRLAAVALLGCVVFDGCDGGLARRFGVSSPFGMQLDSLADLSSFGVATGIVTYLWLVSLGADPSSAAAVCVLIVVCAAIRLARFNVSPRNCDHFSGVPTTMVAAVLALNMLLGPDSVPVTAQVAFAGVYALAMVTPFPYVKLARVLRLPLWLWVVPAICAMISVPGTFIAIVGGYLVSGPILWLLRHRDHDPRPALA